VIVAEAGGAVTALDSASPYAGCRLLVTNALIDTELRAVYAG
jgi:hypothetical protein